MLHENDDHLLQRLTARERAIFVLIRQGKSDAEIARETPLRRDTVRMYRQRIMAKLDGPEPARGQDVLPAHHGERENELPRGWERLTEGEFQVLIRLRQGLSETEIARELALSLHTVLASRERIMDKLG